MIPFRSIVTLTALLIAVPAGGQPPATDLEAPEVITSFTAAGTVDFPHSMHAFDLEIECAACHHETNAAALAIPHEEYFDDFWIDCTTCHRSGVDRASPQACSTCHHASPTTIADETLSAKVVIHKSCSECHEAGTGQDAARSCSRCHQPPVSDAGDDTSVESKGTQHG